MNERQHHVVTLRLGGARSLAAHGRRIVVVAEAAALHLTRRLEPIVPDLAAGRPLPADASCSCGRQ